MKKEDTNTLLTEYEVCMNDVSQLDNDIWQSSYVFLGISFIGFTILIQTQAHNWLDFIVFIVTSFFGISLIMLWQKLYESWIRLIEINFHRMREIEAELDMWRERYIYFLDDPKERWAGYTTEGEKKLQELRKQFPEEVWLKSSPGVKRVLRYVIYLILFGWISLVAKQAIFLILEGI